MTAVSRRDSPTGKKGLAERRSGADQLLVCKANGEPGDYRDAGKGFRAADKAVGLQG